MTTTKKSLHDSIEFDCPFTVDDEGNVSNAQGLYAPNLLDEKLDDPRWEMLTGYSGQESYSGPVMHNSEYVGGQLERDILADPGTYVVVAAYWTPEDIKDGAEGHEWDYEIEGWAICKLKEYEEEG